MTETAPPCRAASSPATSTIDRAIDSSCMWTHRSGRECGDGRLSKADATVVRRHGVVGPEAEATAEMRGKALDQQLVLKHTARGDDRIHAGGSRDRRRRLSEPTCNRRVKR